MHDCAQSVLVCAVLDLLCKGTVESVPEGEGGVGIRAAGSTEALSENE